jgi:hypothetical protein
MLLVFGIGEIVISVVFVIMAVSADRLIAAERFVTNAGRLSKKTKRPIPKKMDLPY